MTVSGVLLMELAGRVLLALSIVVALVVSKDQEGVKLVIEIVVEVGAKIVVVLVVIVTLLEVSDEVLVVG